MLAPLTKITSSKAKFKWTKIKQYAFDEIKWVVASDNLLTYPYFNEEFKIHTNASDLQLVAVINHKGKHIAFYSRKLIDAQKSYAVIEKELLSIIENLKYFITILLGQRLVIYTDNKNLICKFFNTGIVLRCRIILEDYGPDIEYIQGDKDKVADALSRFTINGNQETTQDSTHKK